MRGKNLVALALVLLLYIGPGILLLSSDRPAIVERPQEAKDFTLAAGENWLNPWLYRKQINIDAAGGGGSPPPLFNYTISIDVNFGSGSDTGNSVFCNSHCKTTFADIRFTADDGITELYHWREEYTVSDDATFWVRVSDDLSNPQIIFIYYGNSEASTQSNGEATFPFFDDFENNNLDRWDIAGGEWSTQSSIKKYGTYAAYGDSGSVGSNDRWCTYSSANFSTDIMVHTWFRILSTTISYKYAIHFKWTTNIAGVIAYTNDWIWWNGGSQSWEADTLVSNTWYELELAVDFTNSLMRLWLDGVSKGTHALVDYTNSPATWLDEVSMGTSGTAGVTYDQIQDDFYVRHWIENEPEIGSFGAEEEIPAQWHIINVVTLLFPIQISEETMWAFDTTIMILGLVMIPVSALYCVRGGKDKLSSDKVFITLVIFFVGLALFIGGIMP